MAARKSFALNAKGVGEGVLEYRIDWGPGYRVYFGRDGEVLVILLTGGTKQRQQRDIETAKACRSNGRRRRWVAEATQRCRAFQPSDGPRGSVPTEGRKTALYGALASNSVTTQAKTSVHDLSKLAYKK